MEEKRKCIFTNKPSDAKFTIKNQKYNWAKSAPCTKEYLQNRKDEPITELEIRLIELFYEKELLRLRIDHYESQMSEIRHLISNKTKKLTSEKQKVKITNEEIVSNDTKSQDKKSQKNNIWD